MSGSETDLLPTPAHLDDTHKVWSVFVFIIIFLIISTSIGLLRLILRWRSGAFALDDWVAVPALLLYVVHSIIAAYVNANAGLGKPIWEVTMPEFELWGKGHVATCFLYPLTSGLIRISILLLYDRIFSKANHAMKITIRFSIAFIVCYIVAVMIYTGFLCRPLYKFWKFFERAEYCGNVVDYWIYTAVVYAISLCQDIELLILPIIPVMHLQMSLRKRVLVILAFSLGSLACVAAAYKLAILGMQWGRTGHVDHRWTDMAASRVIPPQFDQYGYTMWIPTQAELSAAVIGSSLIPLKTYVWLAVRKISGAAWGSGYDISSRRRDYHNSSMAPKNPARNSTYYRMGGESGTAVTTDIELTSSNKVRV